MSPPRIIQLQNPLLYKRYAGTNSSRPRGHIRRTSDPPPEYEPVALASTIPQQVKVSHHNSPRDLENKECLHRFLLLCLAANYGLTDMGNEKLTRAEWLAWLHLSKEMRNLNIRMRNMNAWNDMKASKERYLSWQYPPVRPGDPPLPLEREIERLQQEVEVHVVKPALMLGIPPNMAVMMLQQYSWALNTFGGYTPIWGRYDIHSIPALATRLHLDRKSLIDLLTLPHEDQNFRRCLRAKNACIVAKYFETLHSPTEYTLTRRAARREAYWKVGDDDEFRKTYLNSQWAYNANHGLIFGMMKKLFAALPEEGRGKAKPGCLECWARRKIRTYLVRDD